jgi:plastocyanin
MHRSTTALVSGVALAGVLALGACGDDGGSSSASGSDCATTTVEIGDFTFEPATVRVDPCGQVVWHNGHDQAHTASADEGARWNTGNLAPGETSKAVTFDDTGTFTYHCALHPFMKATVQVG